MTHGHRAGEVRFIPARAGNSREACWSRGSGTVHPRAGGEQPRMPDRCLSSRGSSPRGRGTAVVKTCPIAVCRFIPARAGNSGHPGRCNSAKTVHPRAGGEQEATSSPSRAELGSSPRGRGTDWQRSFRIHCCRFIPARAGNRHPRTCSARVRPVHPRAGGEQFFARSIEASVSGSSPRGRGTGTVLQNQNRFGRFIPARAGNREALAPGTAFAAVHPRAGGEQGPGWAGRILPGGSSPRGRGTGNAVERHALDDRFIPARRGEQASGVKPPCPPCKTRFIPAGAGNTAAYSGIGLDTAAAVHPRGRGEHRLLNWRGQLECMAVHPRGRGEHSRPDQRASDKVHPAGDREHLRPSAGWAYGSSPRARGTRAAVAQRARTSCNKWGSVHPRAARGTVGAVIASTFADVGRFIPARRGEHPFDSLPQFQKLEPRFIPARRGEQRFLTTRGLRSVWAVHPRAARGTLRQSR
jgi:hypothetical protein